jgi:N-acetyl-anhydromuramyl-L-alanine amidase AmpD
MKAQGNRYLINRKGVRFMRNDLVEYRAEGVRIVGYVSSLRSSGHVRISDWRGNELANVSVNKLRKLQNRDSVVWEA